MMTMLHGSTNSIDNRKKQAEESEKEIKEDGTANGELMRKRSVSISRKSSNPESCELGISSFAQNRYSRVGGLAEALNDSM